MRVPGHDDRSALGLVSSSAEDYARGRDRNCAGAVKRALGQNDRASKAIDQRHLHYIIHCLLNRCGVVLSGGLHGAFGGHGGQGNAAAFVASR